MPRLGTIGDFSSEQPVQVSYQCNDVMTKLYIGFVEVTGKGGSVNKENPQQTFPVVVVVWMSIAVLPVKII